MIAVRPRVFVGGKYTPIPCEKLERNDNASVSLGCFGWLVGWLAWGCLLLVVPALKTRLSRPSFRKKINKKKAITRFRKTTHASTIFFFLPVLIITFNIILCIISLSLLHPIHRNASTNHRDGFRRVRSDVILP